MMAAVSVAVKDVTVSVTLVLTGLMVVTVTVAEVSVTVAVVGLSAAPPPQAENPMTSKKIRERQKAWFLLLCFILYSSYI